MYMVSKEFNKTTGILAATYKGNVTLKEIVDYIIATKENNSYPRSLKILTDAAEANMNFSAKDLSVIAEENYKSLEKYDHITDAIILTSPKETALSMLYKELVKTNKYKFKVFSTKDAAIRWLELNH